MSRRERAVERRINRQRWRRVLDLDQDIARLRWWQVRRRRLLMDAQRLTLAAIRSASDRRWLQTFFDTAGPGVRIPRDLYVIDGPIVMHGNQRVIDGGGSTIRMTRP